MSSAKAPLKFTESFNAVYRRGTWARGTLLSVGVLTNRTDAVRVGLRTRRGMRGAVVRNRLKRQLRSIVRSDALKLRFGFDVVIVIHPAALPVTTERLSGELHKLCRKTGVVSP